MKKIITLVNILDYVPFCEPYLTCAQAQVVKDYMKSNFEVPMESVYLCFHKDGYFRVGTIKQLRQFIQYLNERRRRIRRSLEEATKG